MINTMDVAERMAVECDEDALTVGDIKRCLGLGLGPGTGISLPPPDGTDGERPTWSKQRVCAMLRGELSRETGSAVSYR